MGVLLQIGVRVGSKSSGHGAKSYEQTLPAISTAPTSSGRQQSRCANTAQATDWPARLLRRFVGGMWLTRSAGCVSVTISLVYAYDTMYDSHRTFGLMTPMCLLMVRCFLMAVAFLVRLPTQQ